MEQLQPDVNKNDRLLIESITGYHPENDEVRYGGLLASESMSENTSDDENEDDY